MLWEYDESKKMKSNKLPLLSYTQTKDAPDSAWVSTVTVGNVDTQKEQEVCVCVFLFCFKPRVLKWIYCT